MDSKILRCRFIEYERFVVDLAMILRALAACPVLGSGMVIIAPRHENLRFHVSWRIRDRKSHARIDVIVGAARHFFPARIFDQITRAVIGEVGFSFRPAEVEFRLRDFSWRAAGCAQQIQKPHGKRIGVPARKMF